MNSRASISTWVKNEYAPLADASQTKNARPANGTSQRQRGAGVEAYYG